MKRKKTHGIADIKGLLPMKKVSKVYDCGEYTLQVNNRKGLIDIKPRDKFFTQLFNKFQGQQIEIVLDEFPEEVEMLKELGNGDEFLA